MSDCDPSPLEEVARPLLQLMQLITGLETTFITQIDWDSQAQEVMYSLNSSDLVVSEGASLDWSDSMCRHMFLSGREQTGDVKGDFPGSLGAEKLDMATFFAVPILADERTIGTVCGASRRVVDIDARTLEMMRLVAGALATQFRTEQELHTHRLRADRAEVLALTDALTGLPNRRAFTSRWEEQLAASGRHGHPIALLRLDVDRFKEVNDLFGHDVGDDVLRAVGDAMRAGSRTEDILGRLGGDEFAVAVPYSGATGAVSLAERIRASFQQRAVAMGVRCTLTIGVSATPDSPRGSLMAAADLALYHGKHQGRDRVDIFDDALVTIDLQAAG